MYLKFVYINLLKKQQPFYQIIMGCCELVQRNEYQQLNKLPTVPIRKVNELISHQNAFLSNPSSVNALEQSNQHNQSSVSIRRRISFTTLFEEDKRRRSMKKKPNEVQRDSIKREQKYKQSQKIKQIGMKTNIQNNLITLKQMFEQSGQQFTVCGICMEIFNLTNRQPIMVCMNQHTFCFKCIKILSQKGYSKCPLDNHVFNANQLKKNRIICQLLAKISQNQTLV